MRIYILYTLQFLKALVTSLLFGASWLLAFYQLDAYAEKYLENYRNDFFLEIIVFFFSGLLGAFLFLAVIKSIQYMVATISSKF